MEVEERRMQLRVVAASRPVLGAGLQALASPPGGAAETERLRLEEKRSYHQRHQQQPDQPFVFMTQARHSRAQHMHAANIISGNLNDGFKSFSV